MKRIILLLTATFLLASIWACSSMYVARDHFASPLATKLVIRNDDYGGGYFGAKRSGGRRHNGADFLADTGTPVLAVKPGVVRYARYKRGNGNYVVLNHWWGYKTVYCHLSKLSVNEGQRVREGQVIGFVGKTGNANRGGIAAHLHFELHKNGAPEDPMNYLS